MTNSISVNTPSLNTLDFVNKCYAFNFIAGKAPQFTLNDIDSQVKLIEEEVQEARDGVTANSAAEVLDGAIDVLVTAFGLLQKLEYAGIDTSKALSLIAENNMQKFTSDIDIAKATVQKYKHEGVETYYIPFGNLYVIKRFSDNKIMKPIGFKSVDLSECIPEGLVFATKEEYAN